MGDAINALVNVMSLIIFVHVELNTARAYEGSFLYKDFKWSSIWFINVEHWKLSWSERELKHLGLGDSTVYSFWDEEFDELFNIKF